MPSESEILEKFPLPQPRSGQIETIKFILDSFKKDKRVVIIEAPCGAGKSPVAVAVARFYQEAYYLTIQKFLMNQLCDDFGELGKLGHYMVDLKGRNAYECTYKLSSLTHTHQEILKWEAAAPHSCADGYCRKKGESSISTCLKAQSCPYFRQVQKAVDTPICLMNFASFLHQTGYTERFSPRNLMILDEGHNIESQLLNFVALIVSDTDFNGLKLPEFQTPFEYSEWFKQYNVLDILTKRRNAAKIAENPEEVDEIQSQISKIERFIDEMQEHADKWVVEYETSRNTHKATFKPIFIDRYAHSLLFSFSSNILIMSATILNVGVITRSLGLDPSQVASKRLGSTFLVEKRPIYYRPAAKIVGGDKNAPVWGPKLVAAVDVITNKYSGMKGIIHTHNFTIAEILMDQCKDANRFLFQKHFRNKAEMLKVHAEMKDSILVAPAMHEGLDLMDDLSRFQIICKLPFPNFHADKQLAARMEIDPQYYDWLTALKLVQSAGRSVRTPEDWADTYILDESFSWWYKRNRAMLPSWFIEAVIIQ